MTELDQRAKATDAESGQRIALAHRLLAQESGGQRGIEEILQGAEIVCGKLRQHLGKRIGPVGFESLLARAIHLSKRRFPFLEGIEPKSHGEDCLGGVRESVVRRDPAEVSEGLATLVANLLFLLGQFVGDDMAVRQIARLWPEVPVLNAGPGPKEMEE